MKNQRTNEITAEDEKLAQDWEKFAEAEGKTYQAHTYLQVEMLRSDGARDPPTDGLPERRQTRSPDIRRAGLRVCWPAGLLAFWLSGFLAFRSQGPALT